MCFRYTLNVRTIEVKHNEFEIRNLRASQELIGFGDNYEREDRPSFCQT